MRSFVSSSLTNVDEGEHVGLILQDDLHVDDLAVGRLELRVHELKVERENVLLVDVLDGHRAPNHTRMRQWHARSA